MSFSKETLVRTAGKLGFDSRYLEKGFHLLSCLEMMEEHPLLKDQLLLKGGTALNLFYLQVPRLSVDIDLNYVGESNVEKMKQIRPEIIDSVEAVFQRLGLNITNNPNYGEHAGLTWKLSYERAEGGPDNIKVDLNFLMRVPLFPKKKRGIEGLREVYQTEFWTQDLHELAGGKLRALFQRDAGRDLYDSYRLLHEVEFKPEWLRLAFVVYGAAARTDWREISLEDIGYDLDDLRHMLLPVLRTGEKDKIDDLESWAEDRLAGCRDRLKMVLPFSEKEMEFLDGVIDRGEIRAELLTDDETVQENIRQNPGLQWKVFNVRKHYGL